MAKKIERKVVLKDTEKAKDQVKNLTVTMAEMVATLNTTYKIMSKLTDYTDKYITSARLLGTTFGKSTREVTKFVNSMSGMTGISETALNSRVALFGQLASSLGVAGDNAITLSENLTTLATKLGMLYNFDFEEMATMLQNAIQGKGTTLASRTGILVNQSTIQNTLAGLGIDKKATALNTAELAIARYLTIQRQLTKEEEIYGEVVNSVAWQKQMLTQQVIRLKTALGNVLYPILQRLLPVFNALLMVLTELLNMLAVFLGFDIKDSGIFEGIKQGTADFGGLAGAVKEASKQLRSFDKLNNLTTPTTPTISGGSGAGIDQVLLDALKEADKNMLNIRNKATEIRDRIMDWLGFTKDVNGEWKWSSEKLLKNIYEWWENLHAIGKLFVGLGLIAIFAKIVTSLQKGWTWLKKISGIKVDGSWGALLKIFSGSVLTFVGFSTIKSALEDINEKGLNIYSTFELIIGSIETISGGINLAKGAMALFGDGVGLVLTTVGLLAGAIVTLADAFGGEYSKVSEVTQAHLDYLKSLEEIDKKIEANDIQIQGTSDRLHDLTEKLGQYVDQYGNVIGNIDEANVILQEINEITGENYTISGNQLVKEQEINGEISTRKTNLDEVNESMDAYIKKLQISTDQELYKEKYTEIRKRNAEAEQELKDKVDAVVKSMEKFDLQTEWGRKKFSEANSGNITDIKTLYTEVETNNKKMDDLQKAMYELNKGNIDEAKKYFEQSTEDVKVDLDEMLDKLLLNSDKVKSKFNLNAKEINNLKYNIKINVDQTAWDKFHKSLQDKGKLTAGLSWSVEGVTFASGGFPTEGQMFFAREDGPELVGTIGNKTTVANNVQIEKGIEEASYQGMMRALRASGGLNKGTTIVQAEGDLAGLMNFITLKTREQDRQYNL